MSPLLSWRRETRERFDAVTASALMASPAERSSAHWPGITLDDVGGLEEAKEQVRDVIDFLRNPKKYQALGAKIPRNILFSGPPGCGKTLLARAVMGESGVPTFYASGAEFIFLAMGIGAARIRDTFDVARAHKPSITLIDDLDAFARKRNDTVQGWEELEQNQTLIQLMNELDDVRRRNAGVLLLATTSRIDLIEPALLQPARFDRIVKIDYPNEAERQSISQVRLKDMPLEGDVDPSALARRTPGFSGADIWRLVNEAALLAARREKQRIAMAEFESVLARFRPPKT